MIFFNRENLHLKDEIEKLQKQLTYEQSKQLIKSPVAHSVSDELSTFNNNTSIDRFLRNVTAGLSDAPAIVKEILFILIINNSFSF